VRYAYEVLIPVTIKTVVINNGALLWCVYVTTFGRNLLYPFSGQMEKAGFSETPVHTTTFFQNQVTSEVVSTIAVKK